MTLSERGSGLPLDPTFPDSSFLALLEHNGIQPKWDVDDAGALPDVPDGTTVLALRYADGVVMAGDRRATAGNVIAHRRIRKVYAADRYAAVGISGTAGMAIELIKLFQTELEHYEKIEGSRLSLEGKANYLARLVRGHLPLAFQGLVIVPLLCGYDERDQEGRLYTFDVVGGRYEEQEYATAGSGGPEARSFLKAAYQENLGEEDALNAAVEALVAAAEEDAATGGPDIRRGIYPNLVTVSATGFREIEADQVGEIAAHVMERRP